jgi:Ser/Thr protein kinase RdoA (MazF antagonist)
MYKVYEASTDTKPGPAGVRMPRQLLPEVVRSEFERLYAFPTIDVPRLMNGGMESAAWHFKTDRGDLVAKIYAAGPGRFERVAEEPVLYEYLNQRGIRTPKVLRSKRSQLVEELRAGMRGYPVIVMEMEDLRFAGPASVQKEDLESIVRTVARMHQCLRLYRYNDDPPPKGITQHHRVITNAAKHLVRSAARIYQPVRKSSQSLRFTIRHGLVGYDFLVVSPGARLFTRDYLDGIRILDMEMKAYLGEQSVSSPLSESLIHGDLALQHMPFLPNGDVYLFDFGDRSRGTVAEELAGMFVSFYIDDAITFDRWERLKEWTLNGYNSQFPLTRGDVVAIMPFIMRRLLVGITYSCEMPGEMQGEGWCRSIGRRYQLASYLLGSKDLPGQLRCYRKL